MSISKQTIGLIGLAFGLGLGLGSQFLGGSADSSEKKGHVQLAEVSQRWTCSMHPQIQQPEQGKCPLCGMDLTPVQSEAAEEKYQLRMSSTAMALANVETAFPAQKHPIKKLRLHGKIAIDPHRIQRQSSHISGRIERLSINFVGDDVRKGQEIAQVYAPDAVTAQRELLEAYRRRELSPALFEAAKTKLRNWKIPEQQLEEIIHGGEPLETISIHADVSGIVTKKHVDIGSYIRSGDTMFEAADLSTVWLLLDVYETDLAWVSTGDSVQFQPDISSEREQEGVISFIDPIVDSKTRVVKARVVLDNSDSRLKPGQFVAAEVSAQLGEEEQLIVPKSAVMWTGERSVVYLKQEDEQGVVFRMQEIRLGASLGQEYVVLEGLSEKDEIAVNGAFAIDSAAQLLGKPSMMSRRDTADRAEDSLERRMSLTALEKKELASLLDRYLDLKTALAADDLSASRQHTLAFIKILENIDETVFASDTQSFWQEQLSGTARELKALAAGEELPTLREAFKPLSERFVALLQKTGAIDRTLYVEYCPMADSFQGASWISTEPEIVNPYFGAAMLGCGEVKEELR